TNEDVSKIVKNNINNKSSLGTKDLDNSFVDNKNRNKKIEISSVLEKSNIKKNDIKSIQKDNLFTNMYLSSQQSVATRHELENVASIKNNIITKQNMAEVKKAAKDLNLEHKESKVINRKESNKYLSKEVVLDKLAFARNILRTNIENILGAVDSTIVKNELSEMPDTILNVNPMNVNNIQSTIIGARQSLSSFMSDFAKKVYQNYKPPVTALRIILNPSSLGSISIIMKSDKDKGISISMNMSNSNTLDMMNDNQSILRNALEKNFESIGEFSLDFNMQDQNSSNKKQDQQENKKNSTSEILENMSNNTSSDNLESDQNYM
ncbi:MAG: flagellar hook-length control protein FliK, partial [Campylobacteraceae bacterium]|nr:flagellar hook-length control protein FliK [Campylobacteraceae bacterium]